MNFYEKFLLLCNKIGKAPNAVGKELGFSTGTITWWKKGKVPHPNTVRKIATYFGVSVDYLLGYETEKIPQDNISEDEKLFLELFRKLSPEKRQMLIDILKIALAD